MDAEADGSLLSRLIDTKSVTQVPILGAGDSRVSSEPATSESLPSESLPKGVDVIHAGHRDQRSSRPDNLSAKHLELSFIKPSYNAESLWGTSTGFRTSAPYSVTTETSAMPETSKGLPFAWSHTSGGIGDSFPTLLQANDHIIWPGDNHLAHRSRALQLSRPVTAVSSRSSLTARKIPSVLPTLIPARSGAFTSGSGRSFSRRASDPETITTASSIAHLSELYTDRATSGDNARSYVLVSDSPTPSPFVVPPAAMGKGTTSPTITLTPLPTDVPVIDDTSPGLDRDVYPTAPASSTLDSESEGPWLWWSQFGSDGEDSVYGLSGGERTGSGAIFVVASGAGVTADAGKTGSDPLRCAREAYILRRDRHATGKSRPVNSRRISLR